MIEEGQIFAERYEIRRILGSGGYSRVYLARQTDLRRDVALKILKLDNAEQPGVRAERFEREARVVARLSDPHTVVVHDFGQDAAGHPFIAFEYVDGVPLGELIKREGRFSERRTLTILEQVLRSLTEAHGLGLVHRDIKPANVIVQHHPLRGEWVKVVDFGIARQLPGVDTSLSGTLTDEGKVIGTPAFMAPEQATGAPISAATDVYACGLLALTMLTGTDPPDDEWALHRRVRDDFEVPDSLSIRPEVRAVLQEMLRTEITERLVDARVALDAISPFTGDDVAEEAGLFPAAVDARGMTSASHITGVTDQVEAVTADLTPPASARSQSIDQFQPPSTPSAEEQQLDESSLSRPWAPIAAIAVILLAIIGMLAWGAMADTDGEDETGDVTTPDDSSQQAPDEQPPPPDRANRADVGLDGSDREESSETDETKEAEEADEADEADETEEAERAGSDEVKQPGDKRARNKTRPRPKRKRVHRPERDGATEEKPAADDSAGGFEPIDDVLKRRDTSPRSGN